MTKRKTGRMGSFNAFSRLIKQMLAAINAHRMPRRKLIEKRKQARTKKKRETVFEWTKLKWKENFFEAIFSWHYGIFTRFCEVGTSGQPLDMTAHRSFPSLLTKWRTRKKSVKQVQFSFVFISFIFCILSENLHPRRPREMKRFMAANVLFHGVNVEAIIFFVRWTLLNTVLQVAAKGNENAINHIMESRTSTTAPMPTVQRSEL